MENNPHTKVRTEEEAQCILDSFPQSILDFLITTGKLAYQSRESIYAVTRIINIPKMPDGWGIEVNSNCFIMRYGDDEQDMDGFWISDIFIEFVYPKDGIVVAKKSVWKKPPLGFCTCGKEMKPLRRLIVIQEQLDQAGKLKKIYLMIRSLWWQLYLFSPRWQYAALYNRHPNCL